MSANLIQDIKQHIGDKPTEDLMDIWIENDRQKWSVEYFEAVRLALLERNETVPSQKKPPPVPQQISTHKKRQSLACVFLLSGPGIYILISLFNFIIADFFWPNSPMIEILLQIRNTLALLCIFIAVLLFISSSLLKER